MGRLLRRLGWVGMIGAFFFHPTRGAQRRARARSAADTMLQRMRRA